MIATGRFMLRLAWFNLRAAMSYRVSFLTSAGFMVINDTMWIAFWALFFSRFPIIRGWTLDDVVTLWCVAATGYGLAWGLFGNSRPEAVRVIVSGRLDYYLSLPRNVLLHFLGGSISVASLGDVLFGMGTFLIVVRPDLGQFALFIGLSLCTTVMLVSFGIIVISLTFWLGNAEAAGLQWAQALLTFSTYPLDIFGMGVKVLLFTVIPAGFASYLPVTILRDFDPFRLLLVAVFTALLAIAATSIFYAGLRRYESGSLVAAQG